MKNFLFVFIAVTLMMTVSGLGQAPQTTSSTGSVKADANKSTTLAMPSIPNKISYQGILTMSSGMPAADGNYDLKFELFDTASNGISLWSETHTGVVVSKGTFSVLLGAVTPLTEIFYKPLWVEITAVAGPGIISPIVFSPRTELASVPYALGPFVPHNGDYYLPSGNLGIHGTPINDFVGLDVFTPYHAVRTKMTESSYSTGFWADKYDASGNNYLVLQTGGLDRWSLGTINNDDFSLYNWPSHRYDFYVTMTGLVGVGTNDPTKKLDVNGSLLARDTVYAAAFMFKEPETSYVSGTSWASGRSLYSSGSFTYSSGLYNDGASSTYYDVDLHLSNGVTIVAVDVYGYDSDASLQLSYNFMRHTHTGSGGSTRATASSGSAFASGSFTATATPSSTVVIDNSLYSYYLELNMPASNTIKYYGYRVTYVQNGPGTPTNRASLPDYSIEDNLIPLDTDQSSGSSLR